MDIKATITTTETPAPRRDAGTSATAAPAAAAGTKEPAEAIAELQRQTSAVLGKDTSLRFSVDEGSGRTIVSIVDAATKEVVRQIPTQEVLELAKALDRMQGMLIRGKA